MMMSNGGTPICASVRSMNSSPPRILWNVTTSRRTLRHLGHHAALAGTFPSDANISSSSLHAGQTSFSSTSRANSSSTLSPSIACAFASNACGVIDSTPSSNAITSSSVS